MTEANDVKIGPSLDPEEFCLARASFYWDGGHAPGSPGAKSGRPSGFGRAIRIGQWVPRSDPIVRLHPEHFETIPRQLTLEDLPELDPAA
jgi:hypothetical protein